LILFSTIAAKFRGGPRVEGVEARLGTAGQGAEATGAEIG